MIDKNRDSLTFYGGNSSDVRMSHWEYHDFIDHLLDDRLTAEGLMKFKRLHSQLTMNTAAIPLVTIFPAWFLNKWIFGFVNRGKDATIRHNFIGLTIFFPIFMVWGFTRAVPRKLYTDLICDNGTDGTYIRETLRTRKPHLWQKISRQLYDNKFMFPEMNEYTVEQFGAGFVNQRVY